MQTYIGSISSGGLELFDEIFERSFSNITLPVLILHGTEGKATSPKGSQQFFDQAGSLDKTLEFYEGGYHDLLNDVDRERMTVSACNRGIGRQRCASNRSLRRA